MMKYEKELIEATEEHMKLKVAVEASNKRLDKALKEFELNVLVR